MRSIGQFLVLMLVCLSINASIYIPADQNDSLIELSQSKQLVSIRALRENLREQPDNLALVSSIIEQYTDLGRTYADERYFSYAETLLKHYLDADKMNETLSVHWADILQHQHKFQQARLTLDDVLSTYGFNSRAYLMRSVIFLSQGKLSAALNDCKALIGRTDNLIVTSCLVQVRSLQGDLPASIELLKTTLDRYQSEYRNEPDILDWSKMILAEMMIRAEMFEPAISYLNEIVSESKNINALYLLSSALIEQQQYRKTMDLLENHKQVTVLLLHYVLAAKKQGVLNNNDSEKLAMDIQTEEQQGNSSHSQVLARYYLDIKNNPIQACQIAQRNWAKQKELADAVILARCLYAINDQNNLGSLRAELQSIGISDASLQKIFNRVSL